MTRAALILQLIMLGYYKYPFPEDELPVYLKHMYMHLTLPRITLYPSDTEQGMVATGNGTVFEIEDLVSIEDLLK